MARSKSVVLTPAEKKAALANLKAAAKAASVEVTAIVKTRKGVLKARAAEDKAHDKALGAAQKAAVKADSALASAKA